MAKKRYHKQYTPMNTHNNNFVQGEKTKLMHGRSKTAFYRTIYKKLDNSLMKEQKLEKLEDAKKTKPRKSSKKKEQVTES